MTSLTKLLEIIDDNIKKKLINKIQDKLCFSYDLILEIGKFLNLEEVEKLYYSVEKCKYSNIKKIYIKKMFRKNLIEITSLNEFNMFLELIKGIKYIKSLNLKFVLTRENVITLAKLNIKGNILNIRIEKASILELRDVINKFNIIKIDMYYSNFNFCVMYNLIIETRKNIMLTLYSNRLYLDDGITNKFVDINPIDDIYSSHRERINLANLYDYFATHHFLYPIKDKYIVGEDFFRFSK